MFVVLNKTNGETIEIGNDEKFITFVNLIQDEIDAHDFILRTVHQCINYLKCWCDDFELIEHKKN